MRSSFDWQLRSRTLPLGTRTAILGIVNVTPDSFSDGGRHLSTQAAVDHALRLLDEGADILDVGGESTRPGSPAATPDAVSAAEEQRRVLPVLAGVLRLRADVIVSIDTYRAATARLALEEGAEIVNDVSGFVWDGTMAATVAAARCGALLMHARGLPSVWKDLPPLAPAEVMPLVRSGLQERLVQALAAGIAPEQIALDPGFGFGKRGAENWALLADLGSLKDLGHPVVAGLSRKGFVAPNVPAAERDPETHAANTVAILHGAHMVRVHDVAGARRAADIADAVLAAAV